LPFANMSGDPEQEYFSDGVTEDIITDLSKVGALAVVSRNTAFTFKGKSIGLKDVARQLGVSHVLEGSVRKSGKRVRITAQLIEGSSDNHIWAERYDRDLEDIFALQDEISEAIVAALKLKLMPSEKKAIEQRATTNAEAYKFYLMARQYNETANSRNRDIIIRLCQRAIEIDPNYARAWALLAISQSNLRLLTGSAGDNGWDAAERALSLDPNLAEAHGARGLLLAESGKLEEALKEHEVALRLDPESYEVNCGAARCYIAMRRYDDAIRCLEKAAVIAPTEFWALGMVIQCYEAKNAMEAAKNAARRTLERVERVVAVVPDHGTALGFGFTALATLGDADRANDWATRALLLDPNNNNLIYNMACGFVTLGDYDRAIELLERVLDTSQAESFRWFRIDTSLDPIRNDPRFRAALERGQRRLGLSEPSAT
jgi:adenylate cyclase